MTQYSPKQLADLAGTTVRTLHYYDSIGLLVAQRRANGYRFYGSDEVNRLQLIMLYRTCGMPLERIADCLGDSQKSTIDQLQQQHETLIAQRNELNRLIRTVDKTIKSQKGTAHMSDKEKFEGFKRDLVEKNEKEYGQEIRQKYGDDEVNASNANLMGMTLEQYQDTQDLQAQILDELKEAMAQGDPTSPAAQHIADLHRQWLCRFWKAGTYSKAAHAGLAEMYIADDRFKAYYDAVQPGATQFLHDAIVEYCK